MMLLESLQATSPFHSREMPRVSISPSASSATREPVSKVRKNMAILKRAMTERRTRWSGRDWNSEPKGEAEEARTLLYDMQQNVDEADASVTKTRSRLCPEINEYMHSWEEELGRTHHIMDKMWQMMQSNDTKTMNLDKDVEEMVRKAKQTGLTGSTKQHGSGQKKRNKIRNQCCSTLKPADGTHYELCGRMVLP